MSPKNNPNPNPKRAQTALPPLHYVGTPSVGPEEWPEEVPFLLPKEHYAYPHLVGAERRIPVLLAAGMPTYRLLIREMGVKASAAYQALAAVDMAKSNRKPLRVALVNDAEEAAEFVRLVNLPRRAKDPGLWVGRRLTPRTLEEFEATFARALSEEDVRTLRRYMRLPLGYFRMALTSAWVRAWLRRAWANHPNLHELRRQQVADYFHVMIGSIRRLYPEDVPYGRTPQWRFGLER